MKSFKELFNEFIEESVINVDKLTKTNQKITIKGDAHQSRLRGVGKMAGSDSTYNLMGYKISKSDSEKLIALCIEKLNSKIDKIKYNDTMIDIQFTGVFQDVFGVPGINITIRNKNFYSSLEVNKETFEKTVDEVIDVVEKFIKEELVLRKDGNLINVPAIILKQFKNTSDIGINFTLNNQQISYLYNLDSGDISEWK